VFNEAKQNFTLLEYTETLNLVQNCTYYLTLYVSKKTELGEQSASSYQGMGWTMKETWFDSRLR